MNDKVEAYEVYAIKYAHHERNRNDNFLSNDPHDGPMPMDYFVWAIVGNGRTVVVDTGFAEQQALKRGRQLLRRPSAGLEALGIDCAAVADVVLTHLHYDHCGTTADFPNARFHLQDREMAFATGRQMTRECFRHAFDCESVVGLVRAVYEQRVSFVDGDTELAPGISLHHIGGHTDGLQVVRVWTRRGWLVLASDASHYYENLLEADPFPIVFHVGDMLQGFDTLLALSDHAGNIIPGHDPLVMSRYPAACAALEGIAVRLDADPTR